MLFFLHSLRSSLFVLVAIPSAMIPTFILMYLFGFSLNLMTLIEAGKERLRSILMTTIAMIVGMLPIALAYGAGAEVKNGMAWVIIGGLTSSLLLTLLLVPSMYMIIEKLKLKVGGWFGERKITGDVMAEGEMFRWCDENR